MTWVRGLVIVATGLSTVHYGTPRSGGCVVLVHRHTPLLVPVSNVPNHSDRVYQVYADVLPTNDSLFCSVVQGKTNVEAGFQAVVEDVRGS